MKQVVNLRSGGIPIGFGSEADREIYELEVEQARDAQKVPYAVAPRVTVKARDGVLHPGQEVKAEELEVPKGIAPWLHLRRLVDKGFVLERHR